MEASIRKDSLPPRALPKPKSDSHADCPYLLILLRHLIVFWSELKIAQRFNAGQYAFLFVESHWDGRTFLSSPAGLDRHFITEPSVKTLG
jgi:hypothetical protein